MSKHQLPSLVENKLYCSIVNVMFTRQGLVFFRRVSAMYELQEFLESSVKQGLVTNELAQEITTQARNSRDPYSLLEGLKVLKKEALLTRENALSICQYPHSGSFELAYALVELDENELLTLLLRNRLGKNADPLTLANAFVAVAEMNLLTDEIIEILSQHDDPGIIAYNFKELDQQEILTPAIAIIVAGHKDPQEFADLLAVIYQQAPLTRDLVEALATIKIPRYVQDIFSQFASADILTTDLILRYGKHSDEEALWQAFGNLSQISPLTSPLIDSIIDCHKPVPVSRIIQILNGIDALTQERLTLVTHHEHPNNLLDALKQMQIQGLFSNDLFKEQFTAVLKHPYPDNIIWRYKDLHQRGLLLGETGKTNFGHLLTYSELTNTTLWQLLHFAFHEEFDQKHFDSLVAVCQRPLPPGSQGYEQEMIKGLCNYPTFFAYIEAHDHEYGEQYAYPFTQEKLAYFHQKKAIFEQENPDGLFDLSEDEAKLGFYLARNLIRQNSADLLDETRFLLSIPALRELAPTHTNPNEGNELLRLAIEKSNAAAAQILMTIEPVRLLAEANNFYRDEAQAGIDLHTLAQDYESSMRGLSLGEEKRLSAASTHYQPQIASKGGVEMVFQELYQALQDRYRTKPAKLILEQNETLDLPMVWEEFADLSLSLVEREKAFQAYYQHTYHTALRYLSKPNRWMAQDAAYVEVDPENPQERWSTFYEYKDLLVMFWLAANDKTITPTQGYTIASRVDNLITELALLGRAHNWDGSRPRADNPNEMEEFDDLKPDKPSCYSGVKRRLFQSIMGHPLFEFLTLDIIKEELRDFVRAHFQTVITEENRKEIYEALQNYYTDLEVSEVLLNLNISESKQEDFFAVLSKKYGSQFDDDLSFKSYMINRLTLQKDKKDDAHALNFAGEVGLEKLLEKPVSVSALATFGVFQQQQPASSRNEADEETVQFSVNGQKN